MSLADWIELERVTIVRETDDSYLVKYNNETVEVAKDTESHWAAGEGVGGSAVASNGMHLEQRLEQLLIPEHGFFQDEAAPDFAKEVMIFHEIRESEYAKAGFEDAHTRAVHDEMLYVLKYFTPEQQEEYWGFAERYRKPIEEGKGFERELRRLEKPPEGMGYLNDKQYSPKDYKTVRRIYWLGKAWDNKKFKQYETEIKQELMKLIAKYPSLAMCVLKDWAPERSRSYERDLVVAVARSPEHSAHAGWEWPDERFNRYAKMLAAAVAQSPEYSYHAGWLWWSDERFNSHAEKLVAAVARDSQWSYTAGHDWFDKRFNPHAERLVAAVERSPQYSYQAGRDWSDERFNPYAEKLVAVVARDPEQSYKAGREWPDERFNPHAERLAAAVRGSPPDLQNASEDFIGGWPNQKFKWPESRQIYLK